MVKHLAGKVLEGKGVGIYMEAPSKTEDYFVRAHAYKLKLVNFNTAEGQRYVEKNVCVQQGRRTHQGPSPLARAAGKGHEGMVRFWVGKDVDFESGDDSGRTPLSWAAGN